MVSGKEISLSESLGDLHPALRLFCPFMVSDNFSVLYLYFLVQSVFVFRLFKPPLLLWAGSGHRTRLFTVWIMPVSSCSVRPSISSCETRESSYNVIICSAERSVSTDIEELHTMITQDIVRKLWDEAGYGNVAIWDNDTMTVVPADYAGETAGKKPRVILKPIPLINRFELLDFALRDEELLEKIEETIRAAGGHVTRGPHT
jgi:hypothetical protein